MEHIIYIFYYLCTDFEVTRNNDNRPPMRVVRQHTWGALLILGVIYFYIKQKSPAANSNLMKAYNF